MTSPQEPSSNFTLAVHGGAGTILRSTMNPEREAAYPTRFCELRTQESRRVHPSNR